MKESSLASRNLLGGDVKTIADKEEHTANSPLIVSDTASTFSAWEGGLFKGVRGSRGSIVKKSSATQK